MTVAGIAFRVSQSDDIDHRDFRISLTYVVSNDTTTAVVRLPIQRTFALPHVNGYRLEKFGASETKGVFGGVENTRLKRYSESCERAIGDLLVVTLCEILDRIAVAPNDTVLILGPALPKVVGRFLSLRPRPGVKIVWICPRLLLPCILPGSDEDALLPRYSSSFAEDDWEDERLLVGCEYVPRHPSASPGPEPASCVVQQLTVPDSRKLVALEDLDWRETDAAIFQEPASALKWSEHSRLLLPRELLVAVGHCTEHHVRPYAPTEALRSIAQLDDLYQSASKNWESSAESRPVPTWKIEWVRKR